MKSANLAEKMAAGDLPVETAGSTVVTDLERLAASSNPTVDLANFLAPSAMEGGLEGAETIFSGSVSKWMKDNADAGCETFTDNKGTVADIGPLIKKLMNGAQDPCNITILQCPFNEDIVTILKFKM